VGNRHGWRVMYMHSIICEKEPTRRRSGVCKATTNYARKERESREKRVDHGLRPPDRTRTGLSSVVRAGITDFGRWSGPA
jgi:hypothetical protein